MAIKKEAEKVSEKPKLSKRATKRRNWGGKRKGQGRPKGSLATATKERRQTEVQIKRAVYRRAEELINITMAMARGLSYLYRKDTIRDAKGKFKRYEIVLVEDKKEILDYLNDNYEETDTYYFISVEKPNLTAVNTLLDRGFGKPTQVTEIEGEVASLFGNVTINFTDAKQKAIESDQPGVIPPTEGGDTGDPIE